MGKKETPGAVEGVRTREIRISRADDGSRESRLDAHSGRGSKIDAIVAFAVVDLWILRRKLCVAEILCYYHLINWPRQDTGAGSWKCGRINSNSQFGLV